MTLERSGNATSNLAMQGGESPAAEQARTEAEDAQRAAQALNDLNAALRKTQYGASALEQDLADVKTATQGAGRAQYELATQGMDGSQVAAYNYNAALEAQIQVLLDVANGTENASDNMKKLANDAVNLTIDSNALLVIAKKVSTDAFCAVAKSSGLIVMVVPLMRFI